MADELNALDENLRIHDLIKDKALKYKVDPELVKVIAQHESNYDPKAVSPITDSGIAKGVMQLTDATAKDLGVNDPFDPEQNIEGGVKYLAHLQDKYKGDKRKIAAAYHSGEGIVDKGGELGPNGKAYVDYVDKNYTPDPLSGLDIATADVPMQVQQIRKKFPKGLGHTAEERQMQTQMIAQDIEKSQNYPIERQMEKSREFPEMPSSTPEWRQRKPQGVERFLANAGEFGGLPTYQMWTDLSQYWSDPFTSDWEKIKGYGTGAVEMVKGMADMHRGYLSAALDNALKAKQSTDPFDVLHYSAESLRNAVGGVVPFFGPGTAEAARMAEEGDWAGGTGALAGTYVFGPLVYGRAGRVMKSVARGGGRVLGMDIAPKPAEFMAAPELSAEDFTRYAQRGAERQGFMGSEEFPPASFQERKEGVVYPQPYVKTEIGPLTVEQLNPSKMKGGAAILGSVRQAMLAASTTVPESSAVAQPLIKRELNMRTVVQGVTDKILTYLGIDTAPTPEVFGQRLQREIKSTLTEDEAAQTKAAREAAGLPEMPAHPEQNTILGEALKNTLPAELGPEDLAKQNAAQMNEAQGAASFLSNIQTPAQAGDFVRSVIQGVIGFVKYREGKVIGGGTERLLGDEAYESLKRRVRILPHTDEVELTKSVKTAETLNNLDENQRGALMGSLFPALKRAVGTIIDASKKAEAPEGQPQGTYAYNDRGVLAYIPPTEAAAEPKLSDWNTVFEAYKNFRNAEQSQTNKHLGRPMAILGKAIHEDLYDALLNIDKRAGKAIGGADIAQEFKDIGDNYYRIAEATRNKLIPNLLTDKNPLVQEHVGNAVMTSKNINGVMDGLYNAMTASWDPNAADTRTAVQAMNALKRGLWNDLVTKTSKKSGPLGESKADYNKIVNTLTTDTRYERAFNWAPALSDESAAFNKFLSFAKARARSEAQAPHPVEMTNMFEQVRAAGREEVVDKLTHTWGLDDAEALRQHIDSNPTNKSLDKELRIGVLESLYRQASDVNGKLDLEKLHKTLVERSQELKALIPDDGKGVSLSKLRTSLEDAIQSKDSKWTTTKFLRSQVIDNPAADQILPSLFQHSSILPWKRLLNRVKQDPDFVRQMVLASWHDLVKENTANTITGAWGSEQMGPGTGGTGPMTYTSGTHFYNDYIQGRPKLIAALSHLEKNEANTILTEMDSIANSTKGHQATLAMLRSKGMTKALSAISSLTQSEASLATGDVGRIVSLISRMSMRLGAAKYFMTPAQSPYVEPGQLSRAAWRQSASILKYIISNLDPRDTASIYTLSKALVPREARQVISNLQKGNDADGRPLNPYSPYQKSMPAMPARPAMMTGAHP